MNRPTGVIVSATILFLIAFGQLATGALMLVVGAVMNHQVHTASNKDLTSVALVTSWMHFIPIIIACIFFAVVAWSTATAIGILRLRNWGRISILIIGGCLSVLSLFSLFGTLMATMAATSIPGQSQLPAMHIGFAIAALFYLATLAVGVWWLVYFNLRVTRACFLAPVPALLPDGTPLPVSYPATTRSYFPPAPIAIKILGWLLLIGVPFCLVFALLPVPAFFLGFMLTGAGKAAVYLAFAGISLYCGWGLLHLRESARRVAIGLQCLGILQALLMMIPAVARRQLDYMNAFSRSMAFPLPRVDSTETYFMVARIHVFSMMIGMVAALTINGLFLWFLYCYRDAFHRADSASPAF